MNTDVLAVKETRAGIFWRRLLAILISLGLAFSLTSASQAALINHKLSGPLLDDRDVQPQWALSPDGRYALFTVDRVTNEQYELYCVPLYSQVPVRISAALGVNDDVSQFVITQDSQHVVFATTTGSAQLKGLFSVPITGGETPIPLNIALPANGGYIESFQVSQDGQHVVYLVGTNGDDKYLYSTPIHGGGSVSIYETPDNMYSGIYEYALTPDSTKIVFLAGIGTLSYPAIRLFFAPVAGGDPTIINGAHNFDFLIAPDSLGVAYLGGTIWGESPNFYFEYFPGDGSSTPLWMAAEGIGSYTFSPDSQTLVYTDDEDGLELFAQPRDGGTRIPLSGNLVPNGEVTGFQITPDGEYVVYRADQNTDELFQLFLVPLAVGTPLFPLTPGVSGEEDVTTFQITPDSLSVVYIADQETDGKDELYAWKAGITYELNGDIIPAGGDVTDFAIFPNSLGVVYRADQEVDARYELYAWTGTAFKIDGGLVANGDVYEFAVTPDNLGAVYRADQEIDSKHELFMTHEEFPRVYMPLAQK